MLKTVAARTPSSNTSFGRFWARLLQLFGIFSAKDREYSRQCKHAIRNIKHSHVHFFNPYQETALPALPIFFLSIYKSVKPVQKILSQAKMSHELRSIIIELFLDQDDRRIINRMRNCQNNPRDPQLRLDMSAPNGSIAEETVQSIRQLQTHITPSTYSAIDRCYNLMVDFIEFALFDYYYLLKRFDSAFVEHDPDYKPNFHVIKCRPIINSIRDFLDISYLNIAQDDWHHIFKALQRYTGIDVASSNKWRRLSNNLEQVLRSRVLIDAVRLFDKDLEYNPKPIYSRRKIAEEYFQGLHKQAKILMYTSISQTLREQAKKHEQEIYQNTSQNGLQHYIVEANSRYMQYHLIGFTYTDALHHLKAFLSGPFGTNILEFFRETIMLQGNWNDREQYNHFSSLLHQIVTDQHEIDTFDEQLSDTGTMGRILSRGMDNVKSGGRVAHIHVEHLLKTINDQALQLSEEGYLNLTNIIGLVKILAHDFTNREHVVINNWSVLNAHCQNKLRAQLLNSYKSIHNFLCLIRIFLNSHRKQ